LSCFHLILGFAKPAYERAFLLGNHEMTFLKYFVPMEEAEEAEG